MENVPVPLHWVGPDGKILWANKAELALLGYPPEEYVGHNISEFHLDEPVVADILRRLTADQPIIGYEARLRCRDGSIRYVSISSSVYRRAGDFIHSRCVSLDITARKKDAETRQLLSAIVESSDDAIISKDLDGIIRSWNRGAERLFGYTSAEIIGKHISTLAAPDRINEIPDILDRLRRGERVDHYMTKRRTKDGKILTVSLTVSPIRDSSGVVIGASKVARDMTEPERNKQALRQANEALTHSNADLQQFAYSASHDLQEPLRMVSTYSELLRKEFGSKLGPDADEYIEFTIQGALRMEQLLRDLRAFVVSSSDQEATSDIDAGSVLDKTLTTLHNSIQGSGAAITRTPMPQVRIHEFQLEQLFQNLIGNAIHYRSSEPPRIHISASELPGEWIFLVRDNGIGIDPQYQEQIFGMFKRLHSLSEYAGTGMGLAICQRIVQRIGGRIWVESELGSGSTFFFTIPTGKS